MAKSNFPKAVKTISDLFIRYLFSGKGNEPITRSFINAVMADAHLPSIIKVDVKNPFNIETYQAEKESVLDVLVEDEIRRKFHIEVQVLREDAFIERCIYYNSKVYSRQLVKGEEYQDLKPVISIVLTAYDLFPHNDRLHTSFMMMARENPGQILSDHLQLHFLQLPKGSSDKRGNDVECSLLQWLKFFSYPSGMDEEEYRSLGKEDEGLKMAIQVFDTFQSDPVLRDLAERREKFLLDVASSRNSAIRRARAEGLAEGLAEGRAKGIAEGRAEGRAEGIAEGRAEGIAEGRAEGIAEGRAKEKIRSLLHILTKRLGPLPEELTAKLHFIVDEGEIEQLMDLALDVSTLEEFKKNLP